MKKKSGFTVIEICVVIAFLILVGIIFTMQRFELLSIQRDQIRKLSINEIYYNLEEVYYKKNGYFPEKIDENSIKGIEPNLLTDPSGILINEEHSEYRYEPTECENGKCKKFTIRAKLEKEGDFIKKSRNS